MKTLSHKVTSSTPRHDLDSNSNFSGDRNWFHRLLWIQLPYDHDLDGLLLTGIYRRDRDTLKKGGSWLFATSSSLTIQQHKKGEWRIRAICFLALVDMQKQKSPFLINTNALVFTFMSWLRCISFHVLTTYRNKKWLHQLQNHKFVYQKRKKRALP